MTEHEISSIPVLKYDKVKHGSNQYVFCFMKGVQFVWWSLINRSSLRSYTVIMFSILSVLISG